MKRLFVMIVITLTGYMLSAQSVAFSLIADPQFAWFKSDEDALEPNGSVFNIRAGIEMDKYFTENYAFSAGFGINNMGGNLHYSDSIIFISTGDSILLTPGQNVKHKLQYLELPVGLKLKTEELGYVTLFFKIGLDPMINIKSSATSDDNTLNKENIKESTNLFNLHYFIGAGIEYRLGGNTALIGGIRWTSGLTDVTGTDKSNININSLGLHLGIVF